MAPPRTRKVSRVSVTAVSFSELCLALTVGDFSRAELVKRIGVNDQTLGRWLKNLKDRHLVYICEWRRTHRTGAVAAVWTWGYRKKDVDKPVAKTQREYTKKHFETKQLGVFYDIARAAQRHDD